MEKLEILKKDILSCKACKDILEHDPNPIFQGNEHSHIFQIGQAPSRTVMETGKPFNDASGKKLLDDWYQITREQFYDPDNFYIASIAKCYPGKTKRTGDNPPPISCAKLFLNKELELVEPDLYIVIGAYAAKWLFPDTDFTTLVFQNHFFHKRPLYVLPHPSPLNRKWLKDHPEFEKQRIIEIREKIHDILR